MATNIPPHNLSEVIDATVELIKHPDATLGQLMKQAPRPRLPHRRLHPRRRGHPGRLQDRPRHPSRCGPAPSIEKAARGDKESIVVTEIPYQVNKAKLIERIAELVNEKKIEGIADLRDESNREGMRIVVELKRGENAQVILNKLYALTPMQSTFGIIFLAIVENQPRVLPLHDLLRHFIDHRKTGRHPAHAVRPEEGRGARAPAARPRAGPRQPRPRHQDHPRRRRTRRRPRSA